MKKAALLCMLAAVAGAGCDGDVSKTKPALDAGADLDAGAGKTDAGPIKNPPDAFVADAGTDAGEPYGVCSSDGICFELPTPTAQNLYAGLALTADHALFFGEGGLVLDFDGKGFRTLDSGVTGDLRAAFASSPTDAWIAGAGGTLLHYDGESLSPEDLTQGDAGSAVSDDLYSLWGASADDVWAVGSAGALYHFDGSTWTKQTSVTGEPLYSVWGLSKDKVYAVGEHGILLSYDGLMWTPSALPGSPNLRSIRGSAPEDLWTVGQGGRVLHFDGTSWTSIDFVDPNIQLEAVRVAEAGKPLVLGSDGAIYDYDGTWHSWPSGITTTLRAIVETPDDALYTVGDTGTVIHWKGTTRTTYSAGSSKNRLAIFGVKDGPAWIAGDELLVKNGTDLTLVDPGVDRSLFGGFALEASTAWLVGTQGTVLRWDGKSFEAMDSKTTRILRGVWSASKSSTWIVGDKGTILGLFNETSWVPTASGVNEDLYSVWGSAPNDCWVVGNLGKLLHWDGTAFTAQDSGTTASLRALWGTGKDDVWAVGTLGTILHWNGKAWAIALEGAGYTLNGVWGFGTDDVYAVGSGGTVLHFDGKDWTEQTSPTDATLFGVYGQGTELWAVGEKGVVLVKR